MIPVSACAFLQALLERQVQQAQYFVRDSHRLFSSVLCGVQNPPNEYLILPFSNDLQLRRDLYLMEQAQQQPPKIIVVSHKQQVEEWAIVDILLQSVVVNVAPRDVLAFYGVESPPTELDELGGDHFWELLPFLMETLKNREQSIVPRQLMSMVLSAKLGLNLSGRLTPDRFLLLVLQQEQTKLDSIPWFTHLRQWFLDDCGLDLNNPIHRAGSALGFILELYQIPTQILQHLPRFSTELPHFQAGSFDPIRAKLQEMGQPLLTRLEQVQTVIAQDESFISELTARVTATCEDRQYVIRVLQTRPLFRPVLLAVLRAALKMVAERPEATLLSKLAMLFIKLHQDLPPCGSEWAEVRSLCACCRYATAALLSCRRSLLIPDNKVADLSDYLPASSWHYDRLVAEIKPQGFKELFRIEAPVKADSDYRKKEFRTRLIDNRHLFSLYREESRLRPGELVRILKQLLLVPSLQGKFYTLLIDGMSWMMWERLRPLILRTLAPTFRHALTWPVLAFAPTETEIARRLLYTTNLSGWRTKPEVELLRAEMLDTPLAFCNVGHLNLNLAQLHSHFFEDEARLGFLTTSFFDRLVHDIHGLDLAALDQALQAFYPTHLEPILKEFHRADLVLLVTDHGSTLTKGVVPPAEARLWRTRWGVMDAARAANLQDDFLVVPYSELPWMADYREADTDTLVFLLPHEHIVPNPDAINSIRFTHGGLSPDELIVPWSLFIRHGVTLDSPVIEAILQSAAARLA